MLVLEREKERDRFLEIVVNDSGLQSISFMLSKKPMYNT